MRGVTVFHIFESQHAYLFFFVCLPFAFAGRQTGRVYVLINADKTRQTHTLNLCGSFEIHADGYCCVRHGKHFRDVCRVSAAEMFGYLRADLGCVAVRSEFAADNKVAIKFFYAADNAGFACGGPMVTVETVPP